MKRDGKNVAYVDGANLHRGIAEMKKPRCGTEPAWELFRGDVNIIAIL